MALSPQDFEKLKAQLAARQQSGISNGGGDGGGGMSSPYLQRVGSGIMNDANTRADRFGSILKRDEGVVRKGVQLLGQGAGLAANAIETVATETPGVKQALEKTGEGIKWLSTSDKSPIKKLGDLIGSSKALQTATTLYDTDAGFRDTVDGVANLVRLGLDIDGVVTSAKFAKNVTKKVVSGVEGTSAGIEGAFVDASKSLSGKIGPSARSVIDDVIPTADRFVSTEVTKALDLTQGDVKNISLSTGNDVGGFIAEKNLIGSNKAATIKNLEDFYKKNYDEVRKEIGAVKKNYGSTEIPRYDESLKEIKKQINEVPGLQEANKEVDALLSKKTVTLNDVQRVKELMDEHFSLYKVTGDVSESVAKKGLAKIREDLKKFIEVEVEKETGADIRALNNNVQTSRSINNAIETRSTRGLTQANISAGDIVTFLAGSTAGTPLVGALAVVAKKIYQSPAFKLKFSKWLDGMSDARRLKIQQDIEAGKLPEGITIQSSKTESSVSKSPNNQTVTLAKNVSMS